MAKQKERSVSGAGWIFLLGMRLLIVLVLAMVCSACATNLQARVSGNLNKLSSPQTMAILPIEVKSDQQMEMARIFRQNLYAQLRPSKFILLEPYVVDGLLKLNGLMAPGEYAQLDPMKFGEALGVDAVLISRINKMEKSYLLVHSSIEISVSVQMIDTRSGEILWQAEQTEQDIEGILKVPTSIVAAVITPIYLMTNELKLRQMTSTMVAKLTSIVRHPSEANDGKTFDALEIIASTWSNGKGKKETQDVFDKLRVPSTVPVSTSVNVAKEPRLDTNLQTRTADEKKDPSIWF